MCSGVRPRVFMVLITVAFIYYWQFVRAPESQDSQPAVVMTPDELPTADADELDQIPVDQSPESGPVENDGSATDTEMAAADSLTATVAEVVQAPERRSRKKNRLWRRNPPGSLRRSLRRHQPRPLPRRRPSTWLLTSCPWAAEGWALHVYSFADSAQARHATEELSEKGFQAEQNAVQIPDKGTLLPDFAGQLPHPGSSSPSQGPLARRTRGGLGSDRGILRR